MDSFTLDISPSGKVTLTPDTCEACSEIGKQMRAAKAGSGRSSRRPASVSEEQIEKNWNDAFGGKVKRHEVN